MEYLQERGEVKIWLHQCMLAQPQHADGPQVAEIRNDNFLRVADRGLRRALRPLLWLPTTR